MVCEHLGISIRWTQIRAISVFSLAASSVLFISTVRNLVLFPLQHLLAFPQPRLTGPLNALGLPRIPRPSQTLLLPKAPR